MPEGARQRNLDSAGLNHHLVEIILGSTEQDFEAVRDVWPQPCAYAFNQRMQDLHTE